MSQKSLFDTLVQNLQDTVRDAIQYTSSSRALVIYDEQSPLAIMLRDAYRVVLPDAEFLHFDTVQPAEVLEHIHALHPQDLVILVQSTNFRLNEFRLRIVLFERSLKTIEHLHLNRMTEEQYPTYIDALAYDVDYYRTHGQGIARVIETASRVEVYGPGTCLVYETRFEAVKRNVGDYREMKNVGGTFPIGEVFTEPRELEKVNGDVMIFAFADIDHKVSLQEPFHATVREGILDAPHAPDLFQQTLAMIRQEERVLVREFGLGLNRAMGRHHPVSDITAFERMKGVHLSLGEKHGVYKKPGLQPGKTRYHVDIFLAVDRILVDGKPLFEAGEYIF